MEVSNVCWCTSLPSVVSLALSPKQYNYLVAPLAVLLATFSAVTPYFLYSELPLFAVSSTVAGLYQPLGAVRCIKKLSRQSRLQTSDRRKQKGSTKCKKSSPHFAHLLRSARHQVFRQQLWCKTATIAY